MYIPVFVAVLGPELAKTVERGANNGEAFGPHEFGEEGRDASEAIAIDAVGGTSCSVFVVRGEREEGFSEALNVVEKSDGYAMVEDLVDPPGSACMAY